MTTHQIRAAGLVPEWTEGDRLRKARESAGLGQQELADLIGISRRSVSAYESGAKTKRPYVVSWALATGVSLDWIETGADSFGPPGQPGPGGDTSHALDESNSGLLHSAVILRPWTARLAKTVTAA